MNHSTLSQQGFLDQLLAVVERIAISGELGAVMPLLELTAAQPPSAMAGALAEAFARMVVQLEARQFNLENTIDDLRRVKQELELAITTP